MTEYASRHLLPHDRPLRRDIRMLGWQLRRLVREHGGAALWDTLHQLRAHSEARLQGDADGEQAMADILRGQDIEQLAELTRAMGLFFDLSNLAEDRHRVRVLNARKRAGTATETIEAACTAVRESGGGSCDGLLKTLRIEPVLTAHPTEAKRRSSRRALRRLRRDLRQLDRSEMLPTERRRRLQRMDRDLASLWYTDPLSARKPTVMEELDRTLFAVRTIWRVIPRVMDLLRDALGGEYTFPVGDDSPIRFGNWIGGDRDGNPFVTAGVTEDTLKTLRATSVHLHRRECRRVMQRMTLSAGRADLPERVKHQVRSAAERWPEMGPAIDRLHPDEWLVQWLTVIDLRLAKSVSLPGRRAHPMGYLNTAELAADIDVVAQALTEGGHDTLLTGALRRWRDRLGVFGLHLLRLDVRTNSGAVTEAVGAAMRQLGLAEDYEALDESGRRAALTETIGAAQAHAVDPGGMTDAAADVVKVFELIQDVVGAGDGEAFGGVILSMTHQPSDLLAMKWLMDLAAQRVGLEAAETIPLAPLFETIDDLKRSDGILEALMDDDGYRGYVKRDGMRQMCMVGYSDSAKDGGYLTANWSLYEAQRRLSRVAADHGIELTVFHGRGGAIGRGGGPAARAILSLPPESANGRLRITEQGEVISERYDDPAIARRHLEQLLWATLKLSIKAEAGQVETADPLAKKLADASETAYRALLDMPGFGDFQWYCTALPMIESLSIGSRPSRRTGAASFADLRAIPFTFAWNQVRVPINAFFGLGSAYHALSEPEREHLTEMYRDWPWFRAVINNAELALARCDPRIARRYLELAPEPSALEPIWERLSDEFEAAREAVLKIKGQSALLADVPWLQRTIRVRTPYVDMLNLIQIELRRRALKETDAAALEVIEHTLRGTVQAIASGLRNTG